MTRPLTFELATFDPLLGRECSVCKATGARFVRIAPANKPAPLQRALDPDTDPPIDVAGGAHVYYLVGECCFARMGEVLGVVARPWPTDELRAAFKATECRCDTCKEVRRSQASEQGDPG